MLRLFVCASLVVTRAAAANVPERERDAEKRESEKLSHRLVANYIQQCESQVISTIVACDRLNKQAGVWARPLSNRICCITEWYYV